MEWLLPESEEESNDRKELVNRLNYSQMRRIRSCILLNDKVTFLDNSVFHFSKQLEKRILNALPQINDA